MGDQADLVQRLPVRPYCLVGVELHLQTWFHSPQALHLFNDVVLLSYWSECFSSRLDFMECAGQNPKLAVLLCSVVCNIYCMSVYVNAKASFFCSGAIFFLNTGI